MNVAPENATRQPVIEFANVSYCTASGAAILRNLNFSVQQGETLMLLGRSGSGKTTSLKMINALLQPSSGEVRVSGKPVDQWNVIQLRRSIGYAIQEVGLFPHYTVRKNIGLVPTLQKWEERKIAARMAEIMELVGLSVEEFAGRYPHELSGGQRQRVGLARALAADPPILLMDEPFGALDPITRAEVQSEFGKLQARLKKAVVFVTHDLTEALKLGTRVGLVEKGVLHGPFTPAEFLESSDSMVKAYTDVYRADSGVLAKLTRDSPAR